MHTPKFFFLLLATVFAPLFACAQGTDWNTFSVGKGGNGLYAPSAEVVSLHTLRAIPKRAIVHQVTLWRRINLRRKDNAGFFAQDREITRYIIDAVKRGTLKPFANDSLNRRLTVAEFLERMQIPGQMDDEPTFGPDILCASCADDALFAPETKWEDDAEPTGPAYYLPRDISILELVEHQLTDKARSQTYTAIESVSLILPAELHPTGVEKVIATFSYRELHELVLNDYAWVNPGNDAEPLTMGQALELRLFNGNIVKYSNTADLRLVDLHGSEYPALQQARKMEERIIGRRENLTSK